MSLEERIYRSLLYSDMPLDIDWLEQVFAVDGVERVDVSNAISNLLRENIIVWSHEHNAKSSNVLEVQLNQ